MIYVNAIVSQYVHLFEELIYILFLTDSHDRQFRHLSFIFHSSSLRPRYVHTIPRFSVRPYHVLEDWTAFLSRPWGSSHVLSSSYHVHITFLPRPPRFINFDLIDTYPEAIARTSRTETSKCNVACDWPEVWADLPRQI